MFGKKEKKDDEIIASEIAVLHLQNEIQSHVTVCESHNVMHSLTDE